MKTIAAPAAETAAIDLVVALRATRLDERRDARIERELRAVGEREEGVRGEHGALERVTELARLLDRDAHGVDTAHLTGADAEGLPAAREHDRVRRDVLDDAPARTAGRPTAPSDLAAHDLHPVAPRVPRSRYWTRSPPSTRR